MSISSVRRAFEAGLNGRATCLQATMRNRGAGMGHLLSFRVQHVVKKDGVTEWIEGECKCGQSPDDAAREIGAAFGQSLEDQK